MASEEYERITLGAALLYGQQWPLGLLPDVMGIRHEIVRRGLVELIEREPETWHENVLVKLKNVLGELGLLDRIGGPGFLVSLLDDAKPGDVH